MMTLAEIRQELLDEGRDDYVGLWQVASRLRWNRARCTDSEVREAALEVLRPLLTERLMAAGALQEKGGFLAWACTPEEALARIDAEWRALGRDPTISDVCWFSTTVGGSSQSA